MDNKSKKIIKVALEWFIYIVVFITIVWGTPMILVKMLHTEYPIASITSGSMWPVLKQGDMVFIRGYSGNKQDLKLGDVVVYKNERGFTIHRIVKLDEKTLVTKGDANNIDDAPVEYSQLIGKMVTIKGQPLRIPYLGMLSQNYKPK